MIREREMKRPMVEAYSSAEWAEQRSCLGGEGREEGESEEEFHSFSRGLPGIASKGKNRGQTRVAVMLAFVKQGETKLPP